MGYPKYGLTFEELRDANLERLKLFPGHDVAWSANDWMVALTGEVGELANLLKKRRRGVLRPGDAALPTDQEIADELADIAIYHDLLAANLRVDLAEAIIHKFNATSRTWRLPVTL